MSAASRLAGRPRLRGEDIRYYRIFQDVSEGRHYNEAGVQAIQTSEVMAHPQVRALADPEKQTKALRYLRMLDAVYLTHWAKKNNTK